MLPTLLLKNYVHLQFQLSRNTASNVQVLSPISLINFRIFRKRCRYVRQIWISFPYCKYDILIHAYLSLHLFMIWQYVVYNEDLKLPVHKIQLIYYMFTLKWIWFTLYLHKYMYKLQKNPLQRYPDTCIFSH